MKTNDLTIGTTGTAGCWHGVIRKGKRVIWDCGHAHHNRDHSTASHRSARSCASAALKLAQTSEEQIATTRRWYTSGNARQGDYLQFESDVDRGHALRAIL